MADVQRTKILLAGIRRSGKTSIRQVLFDGLDPKQAFWIEPTSRLSRHPYDTLIPLEIHDAPSSLLPSDVRLADYAALVYVIDIQDTYAQHIARLIAFLTHAHLHAPHLHLDVFVHKAEALSDDYRLDAFRQIQQRTLDDLEDEHGVPADAFEHLAFHLTSIYDHTLHESFAKVLGRLVASLPYLEDLLNVFCTNSQSTKAFLFDVRSRLYLATDAAPVDGPTLALCCDFLRTLTALAPLYRAKTPAELCYPAASAALAPGTTLTYHSVTPHLALVALVPTAVHHARRGLLEYNVVFFREGVREIWAVEKEAYGAE